MKKTLVYAVLIASFATACIKPKQSLDSSWLDGNAVPLITEWPTMSDASITKLATRLMAPQVRVQARRSPAGTVFRREVLDAFYSDDYLQYNGGANRARGDLRNDLKLVLSKIYSGSAPALFDYGYGLLDWNDMIDDVSVAAYDDYQTLQKKSSTLDAQGQKKFRTATAVWRTLEYNDFPMVQKWQTFRDFVVLGEPTPGKLKINLEATYTKLSPISLRDKRVSRRHPKITPRSAFTAAFKAAGVQEKEALELIETYASAKYYILTGQLQQIQNLDVGDERYLACLNAFCKSKSDSVSYISKVDQVLRVSPKAPGVVYRGIARYPKNELIEWLNRGLNGEPLYLGHRNTRQPMFATSSLRIAEDFMGNPESLKPDEYAVIFEIQEQSGVSIEDLAMWSEHPVIIPADASFEIVGMYRSWGPRTLYIQLRERPAAKGHCRPAS